MRVLLIAAVLLGACQSATPSASEKPSAPCSLGRACVPVAEAGGSLTMNPSATVLDRASLTIPQGALTAPVAVKLDLVAPALGPEAAAAVGAATALLPLGLTLRLGPDGTTFRKPVAVSVPFDPTLLPYETQAADVRVVVRSADGRWESLTPSDLSLADGIARVALDHFSDVTVVAPKPNPHATNRSYRLFHGLDDAVFTTDQQVARLGARCVALADAATSYPGIVWYNQDVTSRTGLIKLAPGTDLSHFLRGQNPPSTDPKNTYYALTGAINPRDPARRSYDQILGASLLAATTPQKPADVMKLALQATGGDYQLAVLTAHNVLKEQAYSGRGRAFSPDDRVVDPQATFASKLENLRANPSADETGHDDKLGPWYHAFGVLFVASSLSATSADLLLDAEHATRAISEVLPDWWANIPLVGGFKSSPLDAGKAQVDNCVAANTVKLAAAAKAAALGQRAASATPTPAATPTRAAVKATELACPPTIDLPGGAATLTARRGTNFAQLGGVYCTYSRPGGTLTLEAAWIEQGGDASGYSLGFCGVNPSSQYVYSQSRNARVTQGASGQTTSVIDAARNAYAAGPWLKSVEQVAEPCRR